MLIVSTSTSLLNTVVGLLVAKIVVSEMIEMMRVEIKFFIVIAFVLIRQEMKEVHFLPPSTSLLSTHYSEATNLEILRFSVGYFTIMIQLGLVFVITVALF